jgi:hypothetical protein
MAASDRPGLWDLARAIAEDAGVEWAAATGIARQYWRDVALTVRAELEKAGAYERR